NAIGNRNYSLRIWLKPDLLNKFGATATDVIAAVNDQNAQYATGKIGEEPVTQKSPYVYSITMQGRLQSPSEFENIILRTNEDGSFLRLKDVADVEIGSQQYKSQGRLNGNDAVPIMINLQSGANALNTAKLVEAKMQELSKSFPEGLEYKIPYDTTKFVIESIKEVIKTFVEALILVIIVMYMFLKNFRSTLIPMIAVPVSLLGTFAGLYLLGFSINLLTLFALILAIGIVVDDAIIVVENIDRILHEDEKISVKDAAIQAMQEVSSPVISIVLVLCAVFIPVSFISGFVGEIQKQFALTLAISVTISGFVALTLTPSLCALFLRRNESKPFYIVQKFNDFFDWSTSIFSAGVAYMLKRTIRFVLIFCIMLGAIFYLYKQVPGSLVPEEDQGLMIGIVNLPSASALHRTISEVDSMSQEILKTNGVKDAMAMIGFDLFTSSLKENAAAMFIGLEDWKDRNVSADEIIMELNKKFAPDRNAASVFRGLPPIPG
ncbi:multidrug efflux RND transporter permease subunit CmeB, partial [Campylobacter coli]|nr:multidrug efflux RND transporter permease subunit CmeB [Campylobacter coli]